MGGKKRCHFLLFQHVMGWILQQHLHLHSRSRKVHVRRWIKCLSVRVCVCPQGSKVLSQDGTLSLQEVNYDHVGEYKCVGAVPSVPGLTAEASVNLTVKGNWASTCGLCNTKRKNTAFGHVSDKSESVLLYLSTRTRVVAQRVKHFLRWGWVKWKTSQSSFLLTQSHTKYSLNHGFTFEQTFCIFHSSLRLSSTTLLTIQKMTHVSTKLRV